MPDLGFESRVPRLLGPWAKICLNPINTRDRFFLALFSVDDFVDDLFSFSNFQRSLFDGSFLQAWVYIGLDGKSGYRLGISWDLW